MSTPLLDFCFQFSYIKDNLTCESPPPRWALDGQMEIRKEALENDYYYHIFSRSISKYVVFNNPQEYSRMIEILKLYRFTDFYHKYSKFTQLELNTQEVIISSLKKNSPVLVEIVAYCLMPTHIHLILKQIADNGISKYMAKILNCYSRYFNIKHRRIGHLWAGRFKNVLVSNDEQLLHLTRYIHLNPSSAGLVDNPYNWHYSSFHEYINNKTADAGFCTFSYLFDFSPKEYQKFVLDQKSYQREISLIKHFLIDSYTG